MLQSGRGAVKLEKGRPSEIITSYRNRAASLPAFGRGTPEGQLRGKMRMSSSGSSLVARLAVLAAALMLAACQTTTYETASETNFKPRDKELLAKARYAKAEIPQPYRRAIVSYHRHEAPGSIVIDSDNHYLYLVQNDGKALRYGVTVGEEALAFSGIAK